MKRVPARSSVAALPRPPRLGVAWRGFWALLAAAGWGGAAASSVVTADERLQAQDGGSFGAMPGAYKNRPFPRLASDGDGFALLGFAHLACFPFVPLAPGETAGPDRRERVPAVIRQLDGRRVDVAGFMLPFKFENGRTTEFLIVSSQMVCCYGMQPEPNEWVLVQAPPPGFEVQPDRPLRFYGTLRVRETYEDGVFSTLYHLECEKIVALP